MNQETLPRCGRADCDDGYIIEPPGCKYGDVGIFECPDCERLRKQLWASRSVQEDDD